MPFPSLSFLPADDPGEIPLTLETGQNYRRGNDVDLKLDTMRTIHDDDVEYPAPRVPLDDDEMVDEDSVPMDEWVTESVAESAPMDEDRIQIPPGQSWHDSDPSHWTMQPRMQQNNKGIPIGDMFGESSPIDETHDLISAQQHQPRHTNATPTAPITAYTSRSLAVKDGHEELPSLAQQQPRDEHADLEQQPHRHRQQGLRNHVGG